MSDWDERADEGAIKHYSDWCPDGTLESHRRGAKWQREQLLTDEAVERVGQELGTHDMNISSAMSGRLQITCDCHGFIYDENDGEEFTNRQFKEGVRQYAEHTARAAITALLEQEPRP